MSENDALSPQRPRASLRKTMRSASSPLKPLRATLQNQGLLTPQGTFESMDVDNEAAPADPAKTLISPPPESQTTPRRAGSAPVERPKRKRAQTSLARVSEDEHSDHEAPSQSQPRTRRKPRKHPRPSPPLEDDASPTPDIEEEQQTAGPSTTLLSPHSANPEADYIPPVPATALSRAAIRRARSSTPGRGYSPPRERFTPPRVIIATPSPTKPTSSSRAHKARPSTLAIKKEPPEIDLTKPAPPPSPSDDPILLRARRRARKAASEEPTPVSAKKSRSGSKHARRASDEVVAVESEPALRKERAKARDYFTPREVERVDEGEEEADVLPEPPMPEPEQENEYRAPSPEPVYDFEPPREPTPPRAASPEAHAEVPATPAPSAPSPYERLNKRSDNDEEEEEEDEGVLTYTGRFTQARIPTTADPPTSTTRARRERWGRPVSPFPKNGRHPLGRLPEGEDEEEGGDVGEVPHFEDDEEDEGAKKGDEDEEGEGEEDMELDEQSFAREQVSLVEENPLPPSPAPAPAPIEEDEEDDMESMYADPPAPARAPTPPRRHAPAAETPALPTRSAQLAPMKSAPLLPEATRSPLLPSRSAGSARSPWLSLTSANVAASGSGSTIANAQGSSDSGYDSRSPDDVQPIASTSGSSTHASGSTSTQPSASGSTASTSTERSTLMAPPRRVPSPSKNLPPSSPAPSIAGSSPRPPRRVAVAEKPPVYSPLVARLSSGAAGKGGLEGLVKRRGVRELVEQHASPSVQTRLWSWEGSTDGEGLVPSTPGQASTSAWDASTSAFDAPQAGPSTSMPPPATPVMAHEPELEPDTPTPAFATPTPAPRPISSHAPRLAPSASVSRLAQRFSISPEAAPIPTSLKGKEKEVIVETRTANEKVQKPRSILKKPSRVVMMEREEDERDEAIVDVLLTPQKGEGSVRFR
ncbi:hypothetical protein PENSPDRAFT_733778, partial [Peniophora sp. CONT]